MGKCVDCLRILTTGNEANKAALFAIPSALPALVRLMDSDKPLARAPAGPACLSMTAVLHLLCRLHSAACAESLGL